VFEVKHLAEILFSPGNDFAVSLVCFDPCRYGSGFCSCYSLVVLYFDYIVFSAKLQGLADFALDGIFVERQLSFERAFAFELRRIDGGFSRGIVEFPPAYEVGVCIIWMLDFLVMLLLLNIMFSLHGRT